VKKILITGRDGQVGWELQRTLAPLGETIALDRYALDLGNADTIRRVLREVSPDIIVNAAAYTAVDQAESEPAQALAINGIAPGVMAEEARRSGALLVHYSTDYVFDGSGDQPFNESSQTAPLNSYGRSKLAGEQAIQAVDGRYLILRTSWVYGLRGKNFLRTMLRLASEREELRVVADQIGAPTWSRMIAEATAAALARPAPVEGLYHLTSSGETSWCGFTEALLELTRSQRDREPRLTGIPASEYPLPAPRPANSRLSCDCLARDAGIRLPHWQEALALCLAEQG
jgi:dTDP-4-dehydrorhamnose reductase